MIKILTWKRTSNLFSKKGNTNLETHKRGQKVKNVCNSLKKIVPHLHINGLEQDCGIHIANVMEISQSCTKPSIMRAK